MEKNKSKPIDLRHYKKEWNIIDKRIEEFKKRKPNNSKERMQFLHNHLHNKMYMLANDYKECPDCILECLSDSKGKIPIRHIVPIDIYNVFKEMSKKSKVPITTIVERLIIAPLLIEK